MLEQNKRRYLVRKKCYIDRTAYSDYEKRICNELLYNKTEETYVVHMKSPECT